MKTAPEASQHDLPSADDPGLRFVGPTRDPRAAGTAAASVLEAAGLTPRLDRDTALLFLRHDEYDARRSFFRDLAVVPARQPLERRPDGSLVIGRGDGPDPLDLPFDEACRRLRDRLVQGVKEAVAPFGRVGIWLSGGTDSSAVAAAALEAWRALDRDPRDVVAYHLLRVGFPSEAAPAERVADALGLELRVLQLEPRDPFEGAERLYPHLDAPPDAGGAGGTLEAVARMRDDGVEVFLTGDGGDEAFGPDLPIGLRLTARMPAGVRRVARRARSRRQGLDWLEERLSAAPLEPRPPARRGLHGAAAMRDRRIRCARQAVLVSWLRAVADVMELAVRVPLLDPTVTDLAVAASPAHHRLGGAERPLLRAAFADVLEAAWRGRTKRDQPFVEGGHLQGLLRHREAWLGHLREGVLEQADVVPRDAAARVLEDAGDARSLYRALALVSLELWCRSRGIQAP